MFQLLIDTSTELAFIGLAYNGKLMDMQRLPVGLQNSKVLFPSLLDILSRNRLTPRDIELIGCGVGPGSYTGIRVGSALAQSMAYALRLPLVGICSLLSFKPSRKCSFAAALDAKYGGIYLLKGEADGNSIHVEENPKAVPLEQVIETLKDIEVIVTPHLKKLQEKIGFLIPTIEWEEGIPSGEFFAEKIHEHYKNNLYSTKAELNLLYLRKTQAEIEKEKA